MARLVKNYIFRVIEFCVGNVGKRTIGHGDEL